MSEAIENLQAAQPKAIAVRPTVGGFPCLAEILRRSSVSRNIWTLPACQSVYLTDDGPAVTVGAPLVSPTADVPPLDGDALLQIHIYRFRKRHRKPSSSAMTSISARSVTYFVCNGEEYVEDYPAVEIRDDHGCYPPVTNCQASC